MVHAGCNLDGPDIMTPQQSALHVRGLTKRFDRLAVDALDLTVRAGEFYALVGPAEQSSGLRPATTMDRRYFGAVNRAPQIPPMLAICRGVAALVINPRVARQPALC